MFRKLRLPELKLRRKLIAAAAAVFTAAIGVSLIHASSSARENDLRDANTSLAALARSHAREINLAISPTVTTITAETAEL